MSAKILYDTHCWVSNINKTAFPFSDALNLYLHAMAQQPKNAQFIGRQKVHFSVPPDPLDLAVIKVLGKRWEYQNSDHEELQTLPEFSFQGSLTHTFSSPQECKRWIEMQSADHEQRHHALSLKPRKIFAVTKTKSDQWLASQNQQQLHRAYHAEVLLVQELCKHPEIEIESIWVSLSPCKMCAALITEFQKIKSNSFPVTYGKLDPGPLAAKTTLSVFQFQKENFYP